MPNINRRIPELAMSWDGGDKHGSTMAWAFGCADALYLAEQLIPAEWRYQPGLGLERESGFECQAIAAAVTDGDVNWDDVRTLGTALLRYDNVLERRGETY